MNDFLKRFGFKVSQVDFVWYVSGPSDTVRFDDDKITFTVIDTPNGWQIGNYKEQVIRTA